MDNLPMKQENEVIQGEVINDELQNFINDNKVLSMIQGGIHNNIRQYDRNVAYLENVNDRYIASQNNYYQIENNISNKYSNLKYEQDRLKDHINNSNYPYGFWRYKKLFYYRASPESELCKGNVQEISEEISSRYPMNVHIIPDLNNIPNNIKEIKSDTVFLSIKSIIVIEGEVIDTTQQYEIYQDNQGRYWRNLVLNTEFLKKRFINYSLNPNESSKTRHFIQKMTNIKDSLFLLNRLGRFFKTLQGENIIVMIGNKNVSKDIFWNKVMTPMIDYTNYIALTETVLKEMSIDEILKGKIIIHIDHIPTTQECKEKIKDILIKVLINKSFQIENAMTPTFAQVIITLDEADPFIQDFEHLSDIFYIESMDDILSQMSEINDISLMASIENSLSGFAEELSAIGIKQFNTNSCATGNEKFIMELQETIESTEIKSSMGLPILDPYNDSYKNIIANDKRFKHTYIIANQGFGKSQLIISSIMRDYLLNDCSVVLLDPHGDLAEDLLRIINDKERLVYIDLYFDSSSMPTINLFDSIDKNDEDTIYNVTQLIMSVFKNISSEDKLNGLMENVAENCISVMLREGGGSFWELYQFLGGTGSKDWVSLGKNSPNELEAYFFNYEFDSEVPTRAAVKRRLGKLIRDPKFSAFMNRKSTLDLEELVNTKGKIIIFNIASGRMPNTYQYYMKFLVGYLQLIALKRVSILNKDDRVHTQLYLDEFHLFLDKSKNLEEILTGARKYRMLLTFAHQTIAQIENSNLKEILTTIPTRYFIGNIANKSVEILNKALNIKLENPESYESGQFHFQEDSNIPFKIQNTDRFLNSQEDMTPDELKESIQYQLKKYYKDINPKRKTQPTEDALIEMIQKFKNDLSSKNLTETSCLYKLKVLVPKLLNEIEQNFEYKTIKDHKYTPRVLKRGINEIFKLVFELDFLIDLDEFAKKIASQNENDMFNKTDSGTRQKEFTDDGKTKTEQYYYFQT